MRINSILERSRKCYETGWVKFEGFVRKMGYQGKMEDLLPGDAQIFIPYMQDQKLTFYTIRSYIAGA